MFYSGQTHTLTTFQEYIYLSRYSRFLHDENRRETWPETVKRYFDFFQVHLKETQSYKIPEDLRFELEHALLNMEAMPSMRAVMTAGPALARDNIAGYNCAYIAIDHPKAFAEILYILMNGTGVGFSVERENVTKLPEIPELMYPSDTTIMVPDSKIGWAKALNELISILYTGNIPKWDLSRLRPAGAILKTFGGRCLTGDIVVYKDRKKARGYNEITIQQLFDIQEREKNGKYRGRFKKIKLRSLNEETGEFFRNQLLEIVDNGVQPVYRIVTKNGYRIKSTGNHRFMNAVGEYDIVDNFEVGDMIAVNGSTELKTGTCVDCGTAISRRAIRCKHCFDETQKQEDCSENTARARKEVKDYKKLHISCELCGRGVNDLECHHIDGNPHNNDDKNLQVLCVSCHRKEDMKRIYFGNPYSCKYMMYDEIIEITEIDEEQTYDLVMEGPNHNFVANGFISHNSSGPEPLDRLFKFVVEYFGQFKGRQLDSLAVHDIACMIGECVVVGGVRRSAMISLSDLSDSKMRSAKTGQWWTLTPWRRISNNSAVYTEQPTMERFIDEWKSLFDSKSGERGIFSRYAARNTIQRSNEFRTRIFDKSARLRDTEYEWGCNPCSEVLLRDSEFCNLSEVVIRPTDTLEDLKRKTRIATIFGTFQCTLTDFKFINKEWKRNTESERLLGVSLTGIMDNPLTNGQLGKEKLKECLTELRTVVVATNLEFAKKVGIPASVASTSVKPSGTVSALNDTSSGIHARHSPYYLRTVRSDKKDPLAQLMIDQGMKPENDIGSPDSVYVFSFPMKSPKNAITRHDMDAIKQLEIWQLYQLYWTDHKPSVTVSVRDHEWMQVGAWVYANFENMSGVSFLPFSDHTYAQAPFQDLTQEQYKEWVKKIPERFDWSLLSKYETSDNANLQGAQELACTAGAGDEGLVSAGCQI